MNKPELTLTQAEIHTSTEQLAEAGDVTVELITDELLPEPITEAEAEPVAKITADPFEVAPIAPDIIAFSEGLPEIAELPVQRLALYLFDSQPTATTPAKDLHRTVAHAHNLEKRVGKNR
jgi:hypothetical protein